MKYIGLPRPSYPLWASLEPAILVPTIVIEIKKEKEMTDVEIRPVSEKDFRQILDWFSQFSLFEKMQDKMVNLVDRMITLIASWWQQWTYM